MFHILDTSRSDGKLTVDFDLVVENIAELNALAGDGVAKIQHTVDGARLKVRFIYKCIEFKETKIWHILGYQYHYASLLLIFYPYIVYIITCTCEHRHWYMYILHLCE